MTSRVRRIRDVLRALTLGVLAVVATAPSAPPTTPTPAPTVTPPTPNWPGNTDTELGARLAAVPTGGSAVIRLGAVWLWRLGDDPLVVRGHVRIVGRGPANTIIDARYRNRIFALRPGAVLELESLSIIRGEATTNPRRPEDHDEAATRPEVHLTDVYADSGIPAGAADPTRYCVSSSPGDAQYFRSSLLTEPLALANVAGNAF